MCSLAHIELYAMDIRENRQLIIPWTSWSSKKTACKPKYQGRHPIRTCSYHAETIHISAHPTLIQVSRLLLSLFQADILWMSKVCILLSHLYDRNEKMWTPKIFLVCNMNNSTTPNTKTCPTIAVQLIAAWLSFP